MNAMLFNIKIIEFSDKIKYTLNRNKKLMLHLKGFK
jgi:hypothetical protein